MADVPATGRLAPTPSAGLHVGNLYASMVAWLLARAAGGRIVLRIEDLDAARCRRKYADGIRRDFERLGITWDNEVILHQSEREEAYREALARLDAMGLLYPCYCSRADLHAASAPHLGERYVYAGTCRDADPGTLAERASRRRPAMRLRMGEGRISIEDGIQGRFEQDMARECGDIIVRRSDGVYAYQLAVVVDDLFQGVNQVVRGCDLLDSTPQQERIRRLLAPDARKVSYWHLPLLTDGQGRRLSKRERDQGLEGIMSHFPSIEAFIGYLAHLVGIRETDEPVTMDALVSEFSIDALKGRRQIRWILPGE